jgi:hypothetical protein
VQADDSRALAKAILKLLNDPETEKGWVKMPENGY